MAFRVRSRLLSARTGCHKRWPKMWAALSPTLDRVVTDVYETTSLAPMNFLAGFRNIFRLWVDDDVLEAHEKALKDNTDPPPLQSTCVSSLRIALCVYGMFCHDWELWALRLAVRLFTLIFLHPDHIPRS